MTAGSARCTTINHCHHVVEGAAPENMQKQYEFILPGSSSPSLLSLVGLLLCSHHHFFVNKILVSLQRVTITLANTSTLQISSWRQKFCTRDNMADTDCAVTMPTLDRGGARLSSLLILRYTLELVMEVLAEGGHLEGEGVTRPQDIFDTATGTSTGG
jgi:hypothetical protein